jgi:hypothetical protein
MVKRTSERKPPDDNGFYSEEAVADALYGLPFSLYPRQGHLLKMDLLSSIKSFSLIDASRFPLSFIISINFESSLVETIRKLHFSTEFIESFMQKLSSFILV